MGGRSRFGVTSWVLCLSILFVFTTTSNAQGLLGGGLPSLPLFGGCGGYSSACGPKARPGYASPALYVGWLYNRYGGNAFAVEFDQPVSGIFGVNHEFFTLSGLVVGLAVDASPGPDCGLTLSGWYLFPSKNTISQEAEPSFAGPLARNWTARTQWWWVDAVADYKFGGAFEVLGGFRYDNFATNFSNPDNNFIAFTGADKSDLTVNSYIPLIGLRTGYGSSIGALRFTAQGFPIIFGRLEYNQTYGNTGIGPQALETTANFKNGYLLEFILDYNVPVASAAGIGLFVRWTDLQATLSTNSTISGFGTSSGGGSLNRKAWTIAAEFRLAFGTLWY